MQNTIAKTWEREAGYQYGLLLEVIDLGNISNFVKTQTKDS